MNDEKHIIFPNRKAEQPTKDKAITICQKFFDGDQTTKEIFIHTINGWILVSREGWTRPSSQEEVWG